jgi:nitroimidazol reductase NimA-like FMN-containing flavoprotein (pyridoxamine 5'-phosphate oxidase superfamily)
VSYQRGQIETPARASLLVYAFLYSVLIHELSPDECEAVLQRATIGRVACAKDGQPYIIPVHVAFQERYLYGVATLGQKIEWMRTNSRVCVEVEEITEPRHWTTVLVFGHYEELPSTSIDREGRARAEQLLAERSEYWLPATAKVPSREHATPVLYRISIIRVTGRRTSRD